MSTEARRSSFTGFRFLIGAASFVVLIAGLREASPLVLPFLVAVFLAVVSVPFMRWLRGLGVPSPLAVIITILAAVGMIALLVLAIGQSVNQFRVAAPRYQSRVQDLFAQTVALLQSYGLPVSRSQAFEILPVELFDVLGGALGAIASFAQNSFLVLLTVVFILLEASGFHRKLHRAFGDGADFTQLERMTRQVQNYLFIKTAVSAVTGTVVGLWVSLLGLDFAVLWGVTAFLFNFIPTLGSILAAVPAVVLGLIQFGPGLALVIAIGYLVINVVFGNLIEPMLLGRRLGLSTLVVFVSLVFWGWVWGPLGMLFSVPLTMVVKIAFENTQDFKWVATMLDANPPPPRATAVHARGRAPVTTPGRANRDAGSAGVV